MALSSSDSLSGTLRFGFPGGGGSSSKPSLLDALLSEVHELRQDVRGGLVDQNKEVQKGAEKLETTPKTSLGVESLLPASSGLQGFEEAVHKKIFLELRSFSEGAEPREFVGQRSVKVLSQRDLLQVSGDESSSEKPLLEPAALGSRSTKDATDSRRAWSMEPRPVVEPTSPSRGRGSVDGSRRRAVAVETFQHSVLRAAAEAVDRVNLLALRLGGILPWHPGFLRPSLFYQWAVLFLHVAIFSCFAIHTRLNLSAGQNSPFLLSDLVLTYGCVVGLLAVGVGTGSQKLQKALKKLEESNVDMRNSVAAGNAVDTCITLGTWMAFLSDRLGALTVPHGLVAEKLRFAALVVTSGEMVLLVLAVLRLARNMSGLVDAFCSRFCGTMDYEAAVTEWNILQASLRVASSAIEWCFAILQSVLVLLSLAMVFDLFMLQGIQWALTASGLLILAMTQLLLRAGAVTDACVRIAQLVNATTVDDKPLGKKRMYLVHYIQASAAGFYVFNVRVGASFVIKVFHYTGLMAFPLARLVLPSNFIG